MKPLPSDHLTQEDSAILLIATRRTGQPAAAILAYMRADRRDAALMLRAQCNRYSDWHPDGFGYSSDPPCLEPMSQECGPTGGEL